MQARYLYQFWQMWIDPDEQKRDLAAKDAGQPLPKQVLIYDKFKEP